LTCFNEPLFCFNQTWLTCVRKNWNFHWLKTKRKSYEHSFENSFFLINTSWWLDQMTVKS
jgi:hypothetical protein